MNEQINTIVSRFKVNRDANATNRGFYYQYLTILEKWIGHFINGTDVVIQTEVEEDIKEIGNQLVFTQVKSYSSSFSLNSDEIKNTLFNFYILFLEYHHAVPDLRFVFLTNSSIKGREEILTPWIADPTLSDNKTRKKSSLRIKEILKKKFKDALNNSLKRKGISEEERRAIGAACREGILQVDGNDFEKFLLSINWEFGNRDPQHEIKLLEGRIASALENQIFKSLPVDVMANRLLTEIHRKSTLKEPSERAVTNLLLSEILQDSQKNIKASVDTRVIELLETSHFKVLAALHVIQSDMTDIKKDVKELKEEKHFRKAELPRELTTIPKVYTDEVVGREKELTDLNDLLNRDHAIVVTGSGGLGKSSLLKEFVKRVTNQFDHVAWVDGSNGFRNSLLYNGELLQILTIKNGGEEKFQQIIQRIKQLNKRTLIIIDDLSSDPQEGIKKSIDSLADDNTWVVITTREKLPGIPSLEIKILSHEAAVELIKKHCPSRNVDDNEVTEFLKMIGYNTLMIELSAKTIEYSLDLSFATLTTYLRNNELDINELNIEIPSPSDGTNTQLLSHLVSTFKLTKLTDNEHGLLQQLSLLPSEFLIEDFILLHGKEFYDANKRSLVNIFNSLHKKGWITRDTKMIRIHRLTQLAIRQQIESFFGVSMLINNYLAYRLKENNDSFDYRNLGFVLIAEAWVNAINKKDREGIEQQLILLETNLLVAYRLIGDEEKYVKGAIVLAQYAERVLEVDSEDFGVIYSNLAIAYEMRNDHEKAVEYSKKSIAIIEKYEGKYYRNLIVANDSLTVMLLGQNKLLEVRDLLKKSLALRKKYLSEDDAMFAVQLNNMSAMYLKLDMIDESIELLKLAITLHNQATAGKNDLMLASYHCNLSVNYFYKQDFEKAELHQLKAISILESKGAPKNNSLLQCYKLMAMIYQHMNEPEKGNHYVTKFTSASS